MNTSKTLIRYRILGMLPFAVFYFVLRRITFEIYIELLKLFGCSSKPVKVTKALWLLAAYSLASVALELKNPLCYEWAKKLYLPNLTLASSRDPTPDFLVKLISSCQHNPGGLSKWSFLWAFLWNKIFRCFFWLYVTCPFLHAYILGSFSPSSEMRTQAFHLLSI